MDTSSLITLLAKSMLTNDTVNTVAKTSGQTKSDTKNVVSEALPTLLTSVTGMNSSKSGNVLTTLLAQSLANSTKVEEADDDDEEVQEETNALGTSILDNILGSGKTSAFKQIADAAGVSTETVTKILIAAAPFVLSKIASLISTDTSKKTTKSTSKKKQEENTDLTSMLVSGLTSSLLGGTTTTTSKKKKTEDTSDVLGSLAGTLLTGLASKAVANATTPKETTKKTTTTKTTKTTKTTTPKTTTTTTKKTTPTKKVTKTVQK